MAASIGRLGIQDIDTVVITADKGVGALGPVTIAGINEALISRSNDLVTIIRSDRAERIDWLSLSSRLNLIASRSDIACHLQVSKHWRDVFQENTDGISSPLFLYECFNRGAFPRMMFDQVIFRGLNKIDVDAHCRSDQFIMPQLLMDTARNGDIFLDFILDEPDELRVDSETLVWWMQFIQANSSFLRCFGWIREDLMLLLNSAFGEKSIGEKHDLDELVISFEGWVQKNLDQKSNTEVARLLALLLPLFPLGFEETGCKSPLFILRRRILKKEFGLRRLLASRSWRYTAWLRDLNRDVQTLFASSESSMIYEDGSLESYDQYLAGEIRKILRSRSWKITAPFRRSQSEEALSLIDS